MASIILIGGAGFLGSNLALALTEAGFRVVIFDLFEPKISKAQREAAGIENIIGTLKDETLLESTFEHYRFTTVFSLASTILPGSNLSELSKEIESNFLPSLKLYTLMEKYGCTNLVYLSSGGAIYGKNEKAKSREDDRLDPMNYYGWMKLANEEFIRVQSRMRGLNHLIIRPSNPYGRYQSLIGAQGLVSVVFGKIMRNEVLEVWGDGNVVRDFIYIEDFTKAVTDLFRNEMWNHTLNVGMGEGASVNEIIFFAKKISGQSIDVIYKKERKVDSPYAVLDVTRLKSLIHFNPLTLEKGMVRYWNYLQGNNPNA